MKTQNLTGYACEMWTSRYSVMQAFSGLERGGGGGGGECRNLG